MDGEHADPATPGTAVNVYVPGVGNMKVVLDVFVAVPTLGLVDQSQLNGRKFCAALKNAGVFAHTVSTPVMLKSSTTVMVMEPSPSHSSTSLLI